MGLIDNALNYSSGKNIEVFARQVGQETILGVRDFGPIMDLPQFRKLQNSLGRQTMPIAARPLSSGLGLLIADKFAKAMQGRLSISRHHRGGVTFKAHLPLSRQLNLQELV
jgi:K+-sensing histidine kinase KdpD